MEVEESKQRRAAMVYFKNNGIVVPLYAIKTIKKDYDFNGGYDGVNERYKITINEGVENTPSGIGELVLIFDKKEQRDKKFDDIMQMMLDENYVIHTI